MAVRAWLIGKRELQVGGHPLLGGGTSHASNSGRPGSLAVESTRLSPRMQSGLANASEGAARGFEPFRSVPCRVVSWKPRGENGACDRNEAVAGRAKGGWAESSRPMLILLDLIRTACDARGEGRSLIAIRLCGHRVGARRADERNVSLNLRVYVGVENWETGKGRGEVRQKHVRCDRNPVVRVPCGVSGASNFY